MVVLGMTNVKNIELSREENKAFRSLRPTITEKDQIQQSFGGCT